MKRFLIYTFVIFFTGQLSAQSNDLTVHEWGTFTTLAAPSGELLNGLTKVEEPVPDFVYHLTTKREEEKGIFTHRAKAVNVNTRMETPVIYFYSDKAVDFDVRVDFKGGAISEWYPNRFKGESYFNNGPGINEIDAYYNEVDLSDGYTGYINWGGKVLAPNSTASLSHANSNVSPQWLAPRQTNSNLVRTHSLFAGYEVEKYLFYRGIAHLNPPVNVEFNTNEDLVIENTNDSIVPYVLVYENEGNSHRVIWEGSLNSNCPEIVDYQDQACFDCLEKQLIGFEEALVKNGLYQPEAEALLNTWKESYFHTEGLKVFWIVPRNYVDSILPLKMTPKPDNLERVFVGRSEIVTPGQMESICAEPSSDSGRFSKCYEFMCEHYGNEPLTLYAQDCSLNAQNKSQLRVYPNPANTHINFTFENVADQILDVRIINNQGQVIRNSRLEGSMDGQVNISDLPDGIYYIQIPKSTIPGKAFIKK